jgi:multidrug efflux system outer membrane protein
MNSKKDALMQDIRTALLVGALIMYAGCAVGPDFKSPDKKLPSAWAGIDTASARQPSAAVARPPEYIAWWQTFNDPILTGLVEQALAANLDLKIAESRVRQARAARTIAAAALWPQLDAGGSYTRSHQGQQSAEGSGTTGAAGASMGTGHEQRIDLFQAGLDATWELDIFGGTRRSVEAATADIQAADEDRRDIMVTLIGEVGTTYVSLRGFQQQIAIAQENLAAQEHTAQITRKRYEAGLANGLDMANAWGQAAATRAQIPVFETAAQQAIYSLSVLLAREPAALVAELDPAGPIPAEPAEVPVGLPSDLLRRRPDIRRAEAGLHAATANIGVATADLFPKFTLTGSFGERGAEWQTLGNRNNHVWSVGPSITWPVFAAGRITANIQVQNELQKQALATYDKTVLTALKDVESALVAYANEQRHHAALTDAVANGRKAVDISTLLYTVGRSDFLNVLVSQRALFSYEDALVLSSRNLATDLVALYKALGGGWE